MKDFVLRYGLSMLVAISLFGILRLYDSRKELELEFSDMSKITYKHVIDFGENSISSKRIDGSWYQQKEDDDSYTVKYIRKFNGLDTIIYYLKPDTSFNSQIESHREITKLLYKGSTVYYQYNNIKWVVHKFVERTKDFRRTFYWNEQLGVFFISALEKGGTYSIKSFMNNSELSDAAEHISFMIVNPTLFVNK